jgi:hypothetical protein
MRSFEVFLSHGIETHGDLGIPRSLKKSPLVSSNSSPSGCLQREAAAQAETHQTGREGEERLTAASTKKMDCGWKMFFQQLGEGSMTQFLQVGRATVAGAIVAMATLSSWRNSWSGEANA